MRLIGTEIFWIALAASAAILVIATLLGRALACLSRSSHIATTRFYLAPALGLAALMIIAGLLGRVVVLGNSIVVPLLFFGLPLACLLREPSARRALGHALAVTAFGIACGASVLGPLFAYGALNPHNDTFTYLAHSQWLQEHRFAELISPAEVTPAGTQVLLYQTHGLRMGASYLLALIQSALNLRWAFGAYAALLVVAMAACCLAIGFPLARTLRPMRRSTRLLLLALPAFSLGGIVFAASYGFLPQALGLGLGSALLFAAGPWLRSVALRKKAGTMVRPALPIAILFAGAALAYSEIAPLLCAVLICSGAMFALRSRAWENVLGSLAAAGGTSLLLLNTELSRAYAALRMQAGAVVGTPVDWPLEGFLAHSLGVHGGAWDYFQWSAAGKATAALFVGMGLLALVLIVLILRARELWFMILDGALLPSMVMLAVLIAGFAYFRYAVASPFPTGIGQSWSQFKLSEWSHPFAMLLVAGAVASAARWRSPKLIAIVFSLGLGAAAVGGLARTGGILRYHATADLEQFYRQLRETVLAVCPSQPIYLALGGEHRRLKFRQMAALYLDDRVLAADWRDDGYIFPLVPLERRAAQPAPGQCVVEPIIGERWARSGRSIGAFHVGLFVEP